MEFSNPRKSSWVFRSAFKELLHKEYNHRSELIHYRVVELGGNKGVHKID